MREYLSEAAEIALSSQHRIDLRVRREGIVVRGIANGCQVITQTVPYASIEQAMINPLAIAIQMIEQEIDRVEMASLQ